MNQQQILDLAKRIQALGANNMKGEVRIAVSPDDRDLIVQALKVFAVRGDESAARMTIGERIGLPSQAV